MEANEEIALQDAIRSAIQNHNQGEDDGKAKHKQQLKELQDFIKTQIAEKKRIEVSS